MTLRIVILGAGTHGTLTATVGEFYEKAAGGQIIFT